MRCRYRDGELDPGTRTRFEEHLRGCADCREALELDALLGDALNDTLDAFYPADLEDRFEARLRIEGSRRPLGRLTHWLRHGEFRVPAPVAVAAMLLVVIAGSALLVNRNGHPPATDPVGTFAGSGSDVIEAADAEQEILSLLTRTRTLLLSLTTAHPDSSGDYDLRAEQALSRNLISEYRILEARAEGDDRAEILDLIHDLEVILLDLSTWEGSADAQQVAMLQGGITDRSLIYRLSTYEPTIGGE
jgi:hypothetical protein